MLLNLSASRPNHPLCELLLSKFDLARYQYFSMLLRWSQPLVISLVLLNAVGGGTSGSWPFKNERCTYTSEVACDVAAGGKACVWCEGRGCRPTGNLNVVDVCASAPRRRPTEAVECEDIASRAKCNLLDRCKWCTSTVVHDACFGFLEARRLPLQVFNCTSRTLRKASGA